MNNYDRIAGIYDGLANLVFRGAVLRAKRHHLTLIRPNSKILIIGGGSGQALLPLDRLGFPLEVDFVEPSGKMIEKAKLREPILSNLSINFIQKELESLGQTKKYDCICSFFFLDLFEESELIESIKSLLSLTKANGYLLVSDFQIKDNRWWQQALSGLMHAFFQITTNLQSSRLKDIKSYLCSDTLRLCGYAEYFNGFIFSAAYKKNVS